MEHGIHPMRYTFHRQRLPSAAAAPIILLWFLLTVSSDQATAQQRYWIAFRDRDNGRASVVARDPRALGISDRALWRRAKILARDRLLDDLDLPVHERYIEQLRSAGVTIRATSRWLNAVSAELTEQQRVSLSRLPFIASVAPVTVFKRRPRGPGVGSFPEPLMRLDRSAGIDYGPSLTQLKNINVVDVHNAGITGSGVIVGMLDDGFNQRTVHPVLKNIRVLAEYDFVQRDSNTSRSPGEFSSQGNHGAGTLSVLGGYQPGTLIGAAFGSSFILGKTEIDSVEIRVEEDLFVEGLEWMERLGADVVSASIGYDDWYTYADFDGRTATTTKAARIAARKGVLLVTAMGNEGNYRDSKTRTTGTMIAPADADSILSVGAVNSSGRIAGFSSTGPTADGRIKPEVVAQGVAVYVMYGETGYRYADGTSFSTPLTAGVAALVLSANPSMTPMQVRERLMTTAHALYDSSAGIVFHPNNFFGWGIIDALQATGVTPPVPVAGKFVLHQNYPNPFNGSTTIVVEAASEENIELSIYNLLGQRIRTLFKGKARARSNYFQWVDALDDAGNQAPAGVYLCRLSAAGTQTAQKIVYIK